MKKLLLPLLSLSLLACEKPQEDYAYGHTPETKAFTIHMTDSLGWVDKADSASLSWPTELATATAETDSAIRLNFFGWSQDEDYRFTMQCPDSVSQFGRCILQYEMCGWNQGPAEWDMFTQIMVKDKQTGEWYEFARCITPYGGYFNATWSRRFLLDVTPMMPLLQGETEFKIFYCGWDATEKKAHAVKLKLYYIPGRQGYGTPAWHSKVYDSTLNGNTGYRAWAYGVQPDSTGQSHSIEDAERLGLRTIKLEPGTRTVVLRSCFTGHGQEKSASDVKKNGKFPTRTGYKCVNMAEFDSNRYIVKLNGQDMGVEGWIWERNGTNYRQAGTYKYDRAGWGPGKPCNVHYWVIENIPADMTELTLDMDLYEYISYNTKPNAAYVACYYVEVDAYGYK